MLEDEGSFVQVDEPIINNNNIGPVKNSEEMFIEQKQRIENTKVKNKQKKQVKPKPKQIFNGVFSLITLNDYNFWEAAKFDYELTEFEYIPNVEGEFDIFPALQQYPLSKSLEIRNIALRTVNEVDYDTQGIELNISVLLKGGSHFWIFTRSFVNMDYNEPIVFDTQSDHNASGEVFNKYSSIIRISKEEHSARCFIHFGAFCLDSNTGQISFKTFLKRQLIDSSKNSSNDYMDNDTTECLISLIDVGEEVITTKITMNGSSESNDIKGTFFFPINKRAKVMFSGMGQSVIIKKLICNSLCKDGNGIQFTSEKKTCNCCSIV